MCSPLPLQTTIWWTGNRSQGLELRPWAPVASVTPNLFIQLSHGMCTCSPSMKNTCNAFKTWDALQVPITAGLSATAMCLPEVSGFFQCVSLVTWMPQGSSALFFLSFPPFPSLPRPSLSCYLLLLLHFLEPKQIFPSEGNYCRVLNLENTVSNTNPIIRIGRIWSEVPLLMY